MLDLQNRFDLVSDILRASSDCVKVLDLEGRLIFMSEGGQRVMEIDDVARFIGCPWPDFWQDAGNLAASASVEGAKAGRRSSFQGMARTGKGRERWWDVAVSPILDDDGAVAQILSISRDITDLKEAQNRQVLLNEELIHRIRNTLTLIKAIANRTFRDLPERAAVEAFGARLDAFAGAHDLLMLESWSQAPIDAVVQAALKPHAGDGQIAAAGPHVTLGPRTSLHLALLLHELGTNATKYGALSLSSGRIEVAWEIKSSPENLVVRWAEAGGPPVRAPERTGFGSRLIGMGLGAGQAHLDFHPAGLIASFTTPLNEAAT